MEGPEPETSPKILVFRILETVKVKKVKIPHTLTQITN